MTKHPPIFEPGQSKQILVVEDEARLRQMLHRAIPDMGFEPIGASSGEEALQCMATKQCPVVVLGLNLPGMTGLELFERIRERWPQTQVVILTGFGDLEAARKAIHLDVVDFLTKPCTLGDLENSLDRAWKRVLQARHEPAPKPALAHLDKAHTEDQPPGDTSPAVASLEDLERLHILRALERNTGNRAAAAEIGISVRKLYYRLAEYERKGLLH